jgi:Na+/glutamate symporter
MIILIINNSVSFDYLSFLMNICLAIQSLIIVSLALTIGHEIRRLIEQYYENIPDYLMEIMVLAIAQSIMKLPLL